MMNNGFRSECLGDIAACRKKTFALWLKQTEPKPTRPKLLDALRTRAVAEMYMAQQYESHIRQQLSQKTTGDEIIEACRRAKNYYLAEKLDRDTEFKKAFGTVEGK